MRIAIVAGYIGINNNSFGIQLGGAEKSILSLATGIAERGHEVFIFTHKKSTLTNNNFNVVKLFSNFDLLLAGQLLSYKYSKYWKTILSIDPDIIDIQDSYSFGLLNGIKKTGDAKIIITIRDHWFKCPLKTSFRLFDYTICDKSSTGNCFKCYSKKNKGYESKIINNFLISNILALGLSITFNIRKSKISKTLQKSNGVISNGQKIKNSIIKYSKIPREKVIQIGNFSNYDKNQNEYEVDKFLSNEYAFIGRISHEKGILFLIDVIYKYIQSGGEKNFSIYGDGPLFNLLSEFAEKYSDRIVLHGWIKSEKLKSMLNKSFCLINTTIWDEPFGRTIIDSMMLNLPIISTDLGEPGIMINQSLAGLTSKLDVDEFVSKMKMIENSRENYSNMAKNGFIYVSNSFTEKVILDKYLTYLKKILDISFK